MKKRKAKNIKDVAAAPKNRLSIRQQLDMALQEQQQGNIDPARQRLQSIIRTDPDNLEALWRLSILTQQQGDVNGAIAILEKCLLAHPDFFTGHTSLGIFYLEKGLFDSAVSSFEKALTLKPDLPEALNALGIAYYAQGKLEKAEPFFARALSLRPGFPEAYYNLGKLHYDSRNYDTAIECYRKAIALNPRYADAYNNLGQVLTDMPSPEYGQAAECFEKAIAFNPHHTDAYMNLGKVFAETGRPEDAEACYRKALSLKPDSAVAFSALLFTLNYNPDRTREECLEAAKEYGARFSPAADLSPPAKSIGLHSPPLRIGFVSGDLRRHPVGYFLENIIAHLDAEQFSLAGYVTNPAADDLTGRLRERFSSWNSLVGLDDTKAARLIADDDIHILIDLSGHTAGNRLPVFARKPAPVQVSWLGYFATTGVAAIDYLLADPVSIPPAQQKYFTEQIWYLPETRLCFTPPDTGETSTPLPAQTKGYITFGCFQNPSKIHDKTISLWSRILAALPSSVLRLQNKGLNNAFGRNLLSKRLEAHGIESHRITFIGSVPRDAYLKAYGEVDLILDTFPYPGGTTTCEALWMGVPTLTLAGDTMLSRQGASLLTAADQPDWITESGEEYVARAVSFARDLSVLADLRKGLRESVTRSPLFDAARFARNLENAFREMWDCGVSSSG